MKYYSIIAIALLSLISYSCINEEGEGGTSSIEGKVFKVIHKDDIYSFEADTIPAAKEDVYIVYGNQNIYGDKMETGHDGLFKFRYLTKGSYTIYAYSSYPDGRKVAVADTVTVGTGNTKGTKDIYIHEGKSFETSYIKGTVLVKYYNKGNAITTLKPAYGIRVFIRAKGAPYQFDEIRTGMDGVFMFQKLNPGDYEVFVLTEDPNTEALSPVLQSVSIDKKGIIMTIEKPFEIVVTV